ncbi:unnamed protein product [Symbiodinium sp. KB8]|nr:unnamed protein product [Symbiodinium sp. KB8]
MAYDDATSPSGRDRRLVLQRRMQRAMTQLTPQVKGIQRHYGGDFAFVGAAYVLRVHKGAGPLQWLNSLTQRLRGAIVRGHDHDLSVQVTDTFTDAARSGLEIYPQGSFLTSSDILAVQQSSGFKMERFREPVRAIASKYKFVRVTPQLVKTGKIGKEHRPETASELLANQDLLVRSLRDPAWLGTQDEERLDTLTLILEEVMPSSFVGSAGSMGSEEVKNLPWQDALDFLYKLVRTRTFAGIATYSSAIAACSRSGKWDAAVLVLLDMHARRMTPNVYSYTSAIAACDRGGGLWEVALQLFAEIAASSSEATQVTYSSAISACGRARKWQVALALLAEVLVSRCVLNQITYNCAISACEKSGRWQLALLILHDMQQTRADPDVISFNSSISACEKGHDWETALHLLASIWEAQLVPDQVSISSAISACEKCGQWQAALHLFTAANTGHTQPDIITFNSTISAAEKAAQWRVALDLLTLLFQSMALPNSVSYSSAISACEKAGKWRLALSLFSQMPSVKASQNTICYSGVVSACEKCGQWPMAWHLLAAMRSSEVEPDVITLNSTVSAFEKGGRWRLVLQMLEWMSATWTQASRVTYSGAISACASGDSWQTALGWLSCMCCAKSRPNEVSLNGAIAATEKGGHWQAAASILSGMSAARAVPNNISFSTVISSCHKAAVLSVSACRKKGDRPLLPARALRGDSQNLDESDGGWLKDLPEAAGDASDGSRAAGFESKGSSRNVDSPFHEADSSLVWKRVDFLLNVLPAQDRACQAAQAAMAGAVSSCSAESRTISLKLMAMDPATPERAREANLLDSAFKEMRQSLIDSLTTSPRFDQNEEEGFITVDDLTERDVDALGELVNADGPSRSPQRRVTTDACMDSPLAGKEGDFGMASASEASDFESEDGGGEEGFVEGLQPARELITDASLAFASMPAGREPGERASRRETAARTSPRPAAAGAPAAALDPTGPSASALGTGLSEIISNSLNSRDAQKIGETLQPVGHLGEDGRDDTLGKAALSFETEMQRAALVNQAVTCLACSDNSEPDRHATSSGGHASKGPLAAFFSILDGAGCLLSVSMNADDPLVGEAEEPGASEATLPSEAEDPGIGPALAGPLFSGRPRPPSAASTNRPVFSVALPSGVPDGWRLVAPPEQRESHTDLSMQASSFGVGASAQAPAEEYLDVPLDETLLRPATPRWVQTVVERNLSGCGSALSDSTELPEVPDSAADLSAFAVEQSPTFPESTPLSWSLWDGPPTSDQLFPDAVSTPILSRHEGIDVAPQRSQRRCTSQLFLHRQVQAPSSETRRRPLAVDVQETLTDLLQKASSMTYHQLEEARKDLQKLRLSLTLQGGGKTSAGFKEARAWDQRPSSQQAASVASAATATQLKLLKQLKVQMKGPRVRVQAKPCSRVNNIDESSVSAWHNIKNLLAKAGAADSTVEYGAVLSKGFAEKLNPEPREGMVVFSGMLGYEASHDGEKCQSLFDLDSLVLTADGGFRRPGEDQPLFPMGNFSLKWRWDPSASKLIIDFWKDMKLLEWRWDELVPSKDLRFPSLVADWSGTGHVGGSSFSYSMLSLVAENFQQAEQAGKTQRLDSEGALNDGDSKVLVPALEGCSKISTLDLSCVPPVRLPGMHQRRMKERDVAAQPKTGLLREVLAPLGALAARYGLPPKEAMDFYKDKPGLRLSDLLDVPSTSHGHDNGADVEGNQAKIDPRFVAPPVGTRGGAPIEELLPELCARASFRIPSLIQEDFEKVVDDEVVEGTQVPMEIGAHDSSEEGSVRPEAEKKLPVSPKPRRSIPERAKKLSGKENRQQASRKIDPEVPSKVATGRGMVPKQMAVKKKVSTTPKSECRKTPRVDQRKCSDKQKRQHRKVDVDLGCGTPPQDEARYCQFNMPKQVGALSAEQVGMPSELTMFMQAVAMSRSLRA